MNLLNAGCGTHYADGWVNTDVWDDGITTKPDIKVTPGQPYPFEENHFDAVFLGHVLEHIPWPDVPNFLKDMKRIARLNAPFLVCGPDVLRTIQRWHSGQEPWHMVLSTMEHQDINPQTHSELPTWNGAAHHWNCHHERVWRLLDSAGFHDLQDVADIIPKNVMGKTWKHERISWPIVGHWYWHFAIMCTNAK